MRRVAAWDVGARRDLVRWATGWERAGGTNFGDVNTVGVGSILVCSCRFARLIEYDSTMFLFLRKVSLIFSQLFLRVLWLTNVIRSNIGTLRNHGRHPDRYLDV